jgi:hypothetical protein
MRADQGAGSFLRGMSLECFSMKRAIGLPATTAREQSPNSLRRGRGFCSVLAANAAGYVHVPGRRSKGLVACFGVVRSAMDN